MKMNMDTEAPQMEEHCRDKGLSDPYRTENRLKEISDNVTAFWVVAVDKCNMGWTISGCNKVDSRFGNRFSSARMLLK